MYDVDCDGVLAAGNSSLELDQIQLSTPTTRWAAIADGGHAHGGIACRRYESDGVDDADPPDLPTLAEWVSQQMAPEDLTAFVAQATATAADHADDAIGAEMMALLSTCRSASDGMLRCRVSMASRPRALRSWRAH